MAPQNSTATIALFGSFGDNKHEGSSTVEVKGKGGVAVRQERPFPFPAESSVRLVRIGATGRRAVWVEHNWETDESQLVRAHFP